MNVDPALSRRTVATDTDELRQQVPTWILAVLEASAGSNDMPRHELVTMVLGGWARRRVHEAKRIDAVLKGNPPPPESTGDLPV